MSGKKSAEQYSHDIKVLKYYLEEALKENATLKHRLKEQEKQKKGKQRHIKPSQQDLLKSYKTDQIAKRLYRLLKQRGIPLSALFRISDSSYSGQITNQTLINSITQLHLGLSDQQSLQLVFSMDTSLNGRIDQKQFREFVCTYGVGDDPDETFRLQSSAMDKFLRFLRERKLSGKKLFEEIDRDGSGEIDVNEVRGYLKEHKGRLNENEVFMVMVRLDPERKGVITRKVFQAILKTQEKKDEATKINNQFEKQMTRLIQQLRDAKINPMKIFQQADTDGLNGITPDQLQQSLKKHLPKTPQLQLKKWTAHINYNHDNLIDRGQYINALSVMYNKDQINGFSSEYLKTKAKDLELKQDEQAMQKLARDMYFKIQESGLTRKQVFMNMDKSGDGVINRNELVLGLKGLGVHVAQATNLLRMFDRDNTNSISMEEFCRVLGEDVEFSDVEKEEKEKNVKKPAEKQKPKTVTKKQSKSPIKRTESVEKPIQKKKSVDEKKKPADASIQKKPSHSIQKKQSKITPKPPITDNPISKKQSKKAPKQVPQPPPKPFKQDEAFTKQQQQQKIKEQQPKQQLLSQQQIKEHLVHLATLHKKNKQKLLSFFQKYDKKSTGVITQTNFKTVIRQLIPSLNKLRQSEKKLIVESIYDHAKVQEDVSYVMWLEEVAENFGAGVEKEQEKEKEKEKPKVDKKESKIEKKESKVPENTKVEKKESKLEKKQSKQPEKPMKESKKQEKPSVNPIEQILKMGESQKQSDIDNLEGKRGSKILEFCTLIVQQANKGSNQSLKMGKSSILNCIQFDQTKLQDFYTKAQLVMKKGSAFTDKQFPPSRDSITRDLSKLTSAKDYDWQHITKLMTSPQMFKNRAQPNDIKQGSLGDCYFLSSLSSIAQYPCLAERLVQYEDNKNGFYGVWLCINGTWELITVDGWLVVNKVAKRQAFSQSVNEELWVALLEKAYAKAYGCYQHIVSGRPVEAIRDLTGAPGKAYQHSDKGLSEEKLWNILKEADKKQFIMTAGTDENRKGETIMSKQEKVTAKNIALGHAYSVLDLREVKGERIIKLRNPWGQKQWNGDWSDNSSKWTPQLRKQLCHDLAQDGVFWMPFRNFFHEQFQMTSINFIRPTYFYRTTFPEQEHTEYLVTCEAFTHGFITVTQKDQRKTGKAKNELYARVGMAVFGIKNEVRFERQESYAFNRDACVELEPKGGEEPVVYFNLDRKCQINVNYYGKENIGFKIQRVEDEMFDRLLASMVPEEGKNRSDKGEIEFFSNYLNTYLFFVAKNIHPKQKMVFQVTVTDNPSLEKIPKGKGLNFKMNLSPGETQVQKFRVNGNLSGMEYGYKAYPQK